MLRSEYRANGLTDSDFRRDTDNINVTGTQLHSTHKHTVAYRCKLEDFTLCLYRVISDKATYHSLSATVDLSLDIGPAHSIDSIGDNKQSRDFAAGRPMLHNHIVS